MVSARAGQWRPGKLDLHSRFERDFFTVVTGPDQIFALVNAPPSLTVHQRGQQLPPALISASYGCMRTSS